MKSKRVTSTWEFYRDNCEGFKEPMRKELRKLDDYVSNIEAENEKLRNLAKELYESAWLEYPSAFEHTYAERLRELGVEV